MLRVGQHYTLPPDCQDAGVLFEVLRVTLCSAVVRPLARVQHTVTNGRTGKVVTFSAPAHSFTIAPSADVIIVKEA